MGSTGEASAHGATLNPATPRRRPAGRAAGARPAAGSVPFARQRHGRQRAPAGELATSVGDAAAVLRVIAGADGLDATCVDAPVEDYAGLLAAPSNFRVAAVAEASDLRTLTRGGRAAAAAPSAPTRVLPWLRDACAAYYVLSASEAFGNLSRYAHVDRPRTAEAAARVDHASAPFGAEVPRLRLGAHFLGDRHADGLYGRAEAVRDAVRRDLASVFRDYAFVLPVAPTAPAARRSLTCFASSPARRLSLPFGARAGCPSASGVVAAPRRRDGARVAAALEGAR
ncbi:hypothetical protein JL722_10548 [Aureococcus anophagefferens]|nr:hypothetical protein JL722_10548 [Aureococcus anophagefferens]